MSIYVCIVKTSEKHLKYHVNDLIKFTAFLDANFKTWKYYNVYDYKTKQQVGSFTINNKPTSKKIR
jgi:hypothetical protein